MLPKNKRITRGLFKEIISKKRYFNSEHFTLLSTQAEGGEARFAVSVAKKISKKAVIRNRTRRRVYSAIRNFISIIKPGLYLIVAKPNADKMKGEKLTEELNQLFVSCRL